MCKEMQLEFAPHESVLLLILDISLTWKTDVIYFEYQKTLNSNNVGGAHKLWIPRDQQNGRH